MNNRNLVKHESMVNAAMREKLTGHQSVAVWFTGYSGSGKSTVSHGLEAKLVENGFHAFVLDGDNVRHGINKDLGFLPEERIENIRRIGEVSKLFVDAGFIVLSAFISPYRKDRDLVRSLFPKGKFIEVFVRCPLSECETRDVKGLYKMARNGKLNEFTGISAPYEEPQNPELILDTNLMTIEESIDTVYNYLIGRGIIQ